MFVWTVWLYRYYKHLVSGSKTTTPSKYFDTTFDTKKGLLQRNNVLIVPG